VREPGSRFFDCFNGAIAKFFSWTSALRKCPRKRSAQIGTLPKNNAQVSRKKKKARANLAATVCPRICLAEFASWVR
jgi:hypothetical protein